MIRGAFVSMILLLFGTPALGQVAPGRTRPAFSLSNVRDSTFALATPRTRPLILIFTTKDLGDYSMAWRDSLTSRAGNGVEIQTILDLSDVSGWQRGLARLKIRAKGSKALLDWDGKVAGAWRGPGRSQVVVYAVSPDNIVRLSLAGNATPENVRQVIQSARQMPLERR